jgi:tryptophanyl-tRNA synthetase
MSTTASSAWSDWHALTTDYADHVAPVKENSRGSGILDWLAAGLDPEKCCAVSSSRMSRRTPNCICCSP